ncbi:MAG: LPS export ABC transporter periplasmic protein LptC [Rikenellaceae bacterium]
MYKANISKHIIALLIMGGAISLFSCGEVAAPPKPVSFETLMNEQSDSLIMIMSENGRTSYRFIASRVEGYTLAKEPYREFPQGVEIITYKSDSMKVVDATLTANYAIYYEERKLWEAMGDVTIIKSDGKELYSQQLFWNAVTQKIYSNVDTKIVDNATGDTYIGEGFESDESMEDWSFRRMKGRMGVDLTPTPRPVDTLAVDSMGMMAVDTLVVDSVAVAAADSVNVESPQ